MWLARSAVLAEQLDDLLNPLALVLVYLEKGETFAEVAAGFGAGAAKAWR